LIVRFRGLGFFLFISLYFESFLGSFGLLVGGPFNLLGPAGSLVWCSTGRFSGGTNLWPVQRLTWAVFPQNWLEIGWFGLNQPILTTLHLNHDFLSLIK
jgi:hypothetical protein